MNAQVEPSIGGLLRQQRLVSGVLTALAERARLRATALEILAGIQDNPTTGPAGDEFVGEKDPGTICGPPKGDSVNFQCSKNDFTCASFVCSDVYGDCGGAANSFDCKTGFECKGSGGKDFYDCYDYNCGDSGAGKGGFDCDTKFDFLCAGTDFDCHDDFDCNGGHVFLCTTDNTCNGSFGCDGGGTACDKAHPYNRPDDGGRDTTPGDFLCGYGKGNDFDCNDDFDCTAKDEFDCAGDTDFDCADDFDCGEKGGSTKFECDSDFDCETDGAFDCICKFSGTDKSPDPTPKEPVAPKKAG